MKTIEVKTSELEGAALDWAVAKALGHKFQVRHREIFLPNSSGAFVREFSPSTDWSQGGPLIAANRVSIIYTDDDSLPCAWTDESAAWSGETPLIAACRAIVASKLGDTVQVPADLIGGEA